MVRHLAEGDRPRRIALNCACDESETSEKSIFPVARAAWRPAKSFWYTFYT